MSLNHKGRLNQCSNKANCILVEWHFEDITKIFNILVEISCKIPRTTILKNNNNYWHGVCRSLIFRFPDDLEILKLPNENLIQLKSSSRFGASDLGVNKNRIDFLYRELIKRTSK